MKIFTLTTLLFLISINTTLSQSSGELKLQHDRLIGECENKYFTGFLMELDSTYLKIDSILLFDQLPRIGTINFKNRIDVPTEFTITERAGFSQIMFRFKSDYLTFDNLKFKNHSISFTVDEDPIVPVTQNDLEIVRLAKKLLSKEMYWNKSDDRKCDDDLANQSYSLYCALRICSLEIEEKYNHRNAALQKLRHLIKEKYPDKKFNHRLMDFNNMDEIEYKDVVSILNEIEKCFMIELNVEIEN